MGEGRNDRQFTSNRNDAPLIHIFHHDHRYHSSYSIIPCHSIIHHHSIIQSNVLEYWCVNLRAVVLFGARTKETIFTPLKATLYLRLFHQQTPVHVHPPGQRIKLINLRTTQLCAYHRPKHYFHFILLSLECTSQSFNGSSCFLDLNIDCVAKGRHLWDVRADRERFICNNLNGAFLLDYFPLFCINVRHLYWKWLFHVKNLLKDMPIFYLTNEIDKHLHILYSPWRISINDVGSDSHLFCFDSFL